MRINQRECAQRCRGRALQAKIYEDLIRDRMDNVIKFLADFQIRENNAQGVGRGGRGVVGMRGNSGSGRSASGDVALPADCSRNSPEAAGRWIPVVVEDNVGESGEHRGCSDFRSTGGGIEGK